MRTPQQTLADLNAIAARADETIPGPWSVEPDGKVVSSATDEIVVSDRTIYPEVRAFIMHSREDVPDLVTLVRLLVAECDELRAALAALQQRFDRQVAISESAERAIDEALRMAEGRADTE